MPAELLFLELGDVVVFAVVEDFADLAGLEVEGGFFQLLEFHGSGLDGDADELAVEAGDGLAFVVLFHVDVAAIFHPGALSFWAAARAPKSSPRRAFS